MIPIADNLLNKFTMYKVIFFGLLFLVLVSLIYSALGIVFYKPTAILFSLAVLYVTCFTSNIFISKLKNIPVNTESSGITALILFFIMSPLTDISGIWIYVAAGLLATISKYLFAIHKKHIFNPAAFSLVVLGIFGLPVSFWWIGNSDLFPFVLLVSLLVLRKIRKLTMFLVFATFTLLSVELVAFFNNRNLFDTLYFTILSYPLLFLGAFMLTEPLTTPPKKNLQLIYASIVGMLTGLPISVGPINATPEFALLVGNTFSFYVGFRKRLELTFVEKIQLAPQIYEFIFKKNDFFSFVPGQYLEWTLPAGKTDMRGNRRFFTIASSPTEDEVKVGVRISKKGSDFKNKLLNLKEGEKIYAGNLAGDFILSKNIDDKYLFIAGGIGVTPFRSIVKNAIDKNKKLNATLLYACAKEDEIVYSEIFDKAESIGFEAKYICSNPSENWKGLKGRVNIELIQKEIPDFKERKIYISGPNKLVEDIKLQLLKTGVRPNRIVTDYFSGY